MATEKRARRPRAQRELGPKKTLIRVWTIVPGGAGKGIRARLGPAGLSDPHRQIVAGVGIFQSGELGVGHEPRAILDCKLTERAEQLILLVAREQMQVELRDALDLVRI